MDVCVYVCCLACSFFSVALCGRMVKYVRICWLSPKAAVCTHLTKKSNYPMSCILSYIEAEGTLGCEAIAVPSLATTIARAGPSCVTSNYRTLPSRRCICRPPAPCIHPRIHLDTYLGIDVFQWRFDSSTKAVIAPVPFCNCESILNRLHLEEVFTPQGAIHLEYHPEIVLHLDILRLHFPCILSNLPTDLVFDVGCRQLKAQRTIDWAASHDRLNRDYAWP